MISDAEHSQYVDSMVEAIKHTIDICSLLESRLPVISHQVIKAQQSVHCLAELKNVMADVSDAANPVDV